MRRQLLRFAMHFLPLFFLFKCYLFLILPLPSCCGIQPERHRPPQACQGSSVLPHAALQLPPCSRLAGIQTLLI